MPRLNGEDGPTLAGAFRDWADRALTNRVPDEVRAFSFNLYEHVDAFAMELIGCSRYDAQDQEWACRELFAYRDPLFEMPHSLVGHEWRQGLEFGLTLVREYLRSRSPGHRLCRAEAVTVGFVDGDLHLVWANGEEQERGAVEQ
jgi:hypothetical protein